MKITWPWTFKADKIHHARLWARLLISVPVDSQMEARRWSLWLRRGF